MKRWQGSCIGATLVLLIGGGSLIFLVPFGGAMIAAIRPYLTDSPHICFAPMQQIILIAILAAPIDSTNPSGGIGHFTELTCTYSDGSQKVFGDNEVGLKGMAASFTLAGICGGMIVLFFMAIAAIIGARLVKPKTIS